MECQNSIVAELKARFNFNVVNDIPLSADQILTNGAGLILTTVAAAVTGGVASHFGYVQGNDYSYGLLPAEFESHEAILFGWYKNFRPGAKRAFIDSVIEVAEVGTAVVLVRESENLKFLKRQILPKVGSESVIFMQHDFVMPWVRDFGPVVVKAPDGGYRMIDYQYDIYAEDNGTPAMLSQKFGMPIIKAPLKLHAGNLLSNGMGLCISTEQLMTLNGSVGFTKESLSKIMRKYLGVNELVMLRPLIGEQTGHVDMFATMVAPNVVVVGEYDEKDDPYNVRVLDENAERLQGIDTPVGPMKVVRIPMPPRRSKWWYTYTNVLFANGKLLVPSYQDVDRGLEELVFETFRSVLPGWKIVPIDCTEFVIGNGVLHCATMNLKSLRAKPELYVQ